MSISRLTASVASATNENTLTLANFNLDFSLFKVQPPEEFQVLGSALSNSRRSAAEDGTAHRTARRLGAMFEDVTPSTPSLISAYGKRASEILKKAESAPNKGKKGLFSEHLGADAASVWAGATSGTSAITMHLLACLLARIWTGPQATAIWYELVEERKRILHENCKAGRSQTSSEVALAVSRDLSRADLSQWDASARSWLQIADDVEPVRHRQLMLIANNVDLPVNQGQQGTYHRVLEAWTTAMKALEKLIEGRHQRTVKGAVMLGLSAWHIYPDILVLGDKPVDVRFDDDLVHGGHLTIGLEHPDPDVDEGIHWSLSLAHLRYYGDPIKVVNFTQRDASRINVDELQFVALGSLLAHWGEAGTNLDNVVDFFVTLGKILDHKFSWVDVFVETSVKYLNMGEEDKKRAATLVSLGRRRGSKFLASKHDSPPPLLGLSDLWIDSLLSKSGFEAENITGDLASVNTMRFVALKLRLKHDQCIIRLNSTNDRSLITAVPHIEKFSEEERWIGHMRWTMRDKLPPSCECHETSHGCHKTRCICMIKGLLCQENCHPRTYKRSGKCPGCQPNRSPSESWYLGCDNLPVHERSENVSTAFYRALDQSEASGFEKLQWNLPLSRSRKERRATPQHVVPYIQLSQDERLCDCYHRVLMLDKRGNLSSSQLPIIPLTFCFVGSSYDGRASLYARCRSLYQENFEETITARPTLDLHEKRVLSIEEVTLALASGRWSKSNVVTYFKAIFDNSAITLPSFEDSGLRAKHFSMDRFLKSLRGLMVASKMYEALSGATISLGIISSPLHNVNWIPERFSLTGVLQDPWTRFERPHRFACIAMFESGTFNIDVKDMEDVMAMSARNSIFITDLLLKDPSTTHHESDITRVVGNVGRPGIVMMVAPMEPRIRKPQLNDWTHITHAPFDGKREDTLGSTSLHLAFTEFEIPFNVGDRGSIDIDLCLVETLVQVFDRKTWVADLDVLAMFRRGNDLVRWNSAHCECTDIEDDDEELSIGGKFKMKHTRPIPRELTSFDNWDEILDVPDTLGTNSVGLVRAKDNWLGRLAAASVCVQKGFRTVILPDEVECWFCLLRQQWHWQKKTLDKTAEAVAADQDSRDSKLESGLDQDDDVVYSPDSLDTTSSVGFAGEEERWRSESLPQVFIA